MAIVTEPPPQLIRRTAVDELRSITAAVRLQFTWFGVRKTLTPAQRAEAAESFGAEGQFLSAGKKLIDTTHPAFRAVTAVRGRSIAFWRGMTLPYTEPGIRLLRQDRIEDFAETMEGFCAELAEAVRCLDQHYGELRSTAADRLGRLYDLADYPPTLEGWFAMQWDYPALEPPNYLRQISPRLYVEPNPSGQWTADLTPAGGPVLGPFPKRSDALLAEQQWIETYVLNPL